MSTDWIVYESGDEYPNYSSVEISTYKDTGPIHSFKDLKIINSKDKDIQKLSGTWMIVANGYYYGHYLQETIAPILFYKKYIDPNLNILWIDQNLPEDEHGHNLSKASKEARDMLISENDILIDEEFFNNNYEIENLITFFYNIRFVPSTKDLIKNYSFKALTQNNNNELNKLLRDMYSESLVKDESFSKKIFLSRKKRSELIELHQKGKDQLRYAPVWYHNAIEDYFRSIGYDIIEMSGLTVGEQAKISYNATHIAGIYGTAFLNGIFADQDTKFIAILSEKEYLYDHSKDAISIYKNKFSFVEMYEKDSYQEVFDRIKLANEKKDTQ